MSQIADFLWSKVCREFRVIGIQGTETSAVRDLSCEEFMQRIDAVELLMGASFPTLRLVSQDYFDNIKS